MCGVCISLLIVYYKCIWLFTVRWTNHPKISFSLSFYSGCFPSFRFIQHYISASFSFLLAFIETKLLELFTAQRFNLFLRKILNRTQTISILCLQMWETKVERVNLKSKVHSKFGDALIGSTGCFYIQLKWNKTNNIMPIFDFNRKSVNVVCDARAQLIVLDWTMTPMENRCKMHAIDRCLIWMTMIFFIFIVTDRYSYCCSFTMTGFALWICWIQNAPWFKPRLSISIFPYKISLK